MPETIIPVTYALSKHADLCDFPRHYWGFGV